MTTSHTTDGYIGERKREDKKERGTGKECKHGSDINIGTVITTIM